MNLAISTAASISSNALSVANTLIKNIPFSIASNPIVTNNQVNSSSQKSNYNAPNATIGNNENSLIKPLIVNFNSAVYGIADFEKKVKQIVGASSFASSGNALGYM